MFLFHEDASTPPPDTHFDASSYERVMSFQAGDASGVMKEVKTHERRNEY